MVSAFWELVHNFSPTVALPPLFLNLLFPPLPFDPWCDQFGFYTGNTSSSQKRCFSLWVSRFNRAWPPGNFTVFRNSWGYLNSHPNWCLPCDLSALSLFFFFLNGMSNCKEHMIMIWSSLDLRFVARPFVFPLLSLIQFLILNRLFSYCYFIFTQFTWSSFLLKYITLYI